MGKTVAIGSSPHTWGIRVGGKRWKKDRRFIPTYVGHTAYHCWAYAGSSGSSPPTWGILQHGLYIGKATRFIPTYVGHTAIYRWWLTIPTVHPHLRGAYVVVDVNGGALARFIPTYVGHTLSWSTAGFPLSGSSPPTWGILPQHIGQVAHQAVHPHLRGAYVPDRYDGSGCVGSSPPTWGILVVLLRGIPAKRFIPTYVGHTLDRRKKNGWFQPLLL